MLSQELRESFETVQAIHRVQLSFDSNHTNDHHHHGQHGHYDGYDETIESFPNIKLDDNDQVPVPSLQHGLGERHASASSHFYHNVNYDPSSTTTSSNNANNTTTIMTEADVKAWKFEAALKAAMVAEAEISQLTNGIAELEELLLQKESCRSTRTTNNDGGGGGGGGHGNEQVVDANNELEHHGTLFPSLPPCVMFCDTNSESKNEECNDGDDDDDDGHNMAYSSRG